MQPRPKCFNTLQPEQNGLHCADDILKLILLTDKPCTWMKCNWSLFSGDKSTINTLRPQQNGQHFVDDFLKCIFLNENAWIPIEISLKIVPKGPIDNIPALVQIMAWCRPGDKPLSEPMMVRLPKHICGTLPQWVNRHNLNKVFQTICYSIGSGNCLVPKLEYFWLKTLFFTKLKIYQNDSTSSSHYIIKVQILYLQWKEIICMFN